jgi:hypothetical protein
MTQTAAIQILGRNDHVASAHACPLLVNAWCVECDRDGIAVDVEYVLPCDRGVLRAWMGY